MVARDLEPALEQAVHAVLAAARTLGLDAHEASHGITDAPSALAALAAMDGALGGSGAGPELSLAVRGARVDVLGYELARQRSMLPLLTEALARLRAATTINDLVESIPIQTVTLGYERAMFSWVDHEHWVPRSMHTMSGPSEARAILEAGAPPYAHTRDLMEIDVVRNRRPILVLDAETNPRVHPRITPISRSDTYVAAPVVARHHVAAFVHLDRNVVTGTTDEFDRDLLAFFCESVGTMLDRLLAEEGATNAAAQHAGPARSEWVDVLTAREHEVLRHVAIGLTNAEISARLFISEETTKTHVKKLMRKLGVTNRAAAGAMYHHMRLGVPHLPASTSDHRADEARPTA